MKQILLVEDSLMFGKLTKSKIEKAFDAQVYWARNMAEALRLLELAQNSFSLALLDLNLPDAQHGEIVDIVVGRGITSIVFTANAENSVREFVWSKKVADYIIKEDPNSIEYLLSAMRQLQKNRDSLVLVVDDSSHSRTLISELLYVRQLRVINAVDGKTALEILDRYPEIQLVITDFSMPGMDGCTLCQRIRKKFKPDQLAVIGISSVDDAGIGARFIKSGANDFIIKHAFLVEEFYCRVNHCLETIELFSRIRENSIRDFLTGLYNRRHFFDAGNTLFQHTREEGDQLACALIDIDHFKKVNDTYGHDVGDGVIRALADLLCRYKGEDDIVARMGGEEFCILAPRLGATQVRKKFEKLLQKIRTTPIPYTEDAAPLYITASMGVCTVHGEGLEAMISVADEKLYAAKDSGRNCAVFDNVL
jgi:diguanylate cyclase (GGDEF)-like protein